MYKEVLQAKNLSTESLMRKENVVGVAVGRKVSEGKLTHDLSVVVLVEKKLTPNALSVANAVPQTVWGVPTDVVEVGRLEALRTKRVRPAPGGVSIGHYKITAGTLGVVLKDSLTGKRVILSNNHVLANSNDAQIGDSILQPGYYDGGRPEKDTIARLLRYKEIDFGDDSSDCPLAEGTAKVLNKAAEVVGSKHRLKASKIQAGMANYIDAAVAEPLVDEDVLDSILDIGEITGTVEAYIGMPIRKSGRTTAFTRGSVMLLNGTVNVNYGGGKIARFEEQIISGAMSAGGDSGSLGVFEESGLAFGLLYAGSDKSTIFNPIDKVLNTLHLEF